MRENFPNLYRFYRNNIIKHAIIKAAAWNSLFFLVLVLLTFLFSPAYFIVPVLLFVVGTACGAIVNYLKNLPTDESFAKTLDKLGLSERAVTMQQYKNDDSLIARIQRQNAIDHINKIQTSQLKIAVKLYIIILLIISLIFGTCGTAVSALAANGVIDSGQQIITDNIPGLKRSYEVLYEVDGEGSINGDFFQIIYECESATPVYAEAAENWFFVAWSDGYEDPYRCDSNIKCNLELYAIFAEVGLPDDELEDDLSEFNDEDLLDKLQNSDNRDNDDIGPDSIGDRAGGRYDQLSQVIDGETYYGGNVFNMAYDDAINDLVDNNSASKDSKQLVEDYFNTIRK